MTTNDEKTGEVEDGVEEQPGAALDELPLRWVKSDARWNCRGPYAAEDIAAAVERYRHEPMLHPPSVAREGPERYLLVTGFLRFEVLRQLDEADDALGWFRVVEGTETERMLWNLGENTARRDLTGHELVERVWLLHSRGVGKDRLLRACGFKSSYLNRLLRIRRRAHPELYERFRTDPSLTVARMARLVVHQGAAQMEELGRSDACHQRASEIEQGYTEELEAAGEEDSPQNDSGRVRSSRSRGQRRRLPSRAHVRRLLKIHEKRAPLDPYRRGVVASLRHLLYGDPLGPTGDGGEPAPEGR